MTRQFLDLEGAQTLHTLAYLLTRRAVDDVVARGAMGLVYGAAGCGKTFAVGAAVASQSIDCSWFDFPGRTSTKALVKALVERTTGVPQEGTRRQLEERLMDSIAARDHLIVIDEAQRLYAESIEYLRHLWDQQPGRLALLLVGGDGCWQVISRYPMVSSRLYRRVHFTRLSENEVLRLIPGFHAIYRGAETSLIAEIDREFADGNLRNWVSFTSTAEQIMAEAGKDELTRRVIDDALWLIGDIPTAP